MSRRTVRSVTAKAGVVPPARTCRLALGALSIDTTRVQRWALVAAFAVALVACGDDASVGGCPDTAICVPDGGSGGGSGTCNPLMQTGCAIGEKCTWLIDSLMPLAGRAGCAPDGTAGPGEPCQYGPPGATGYDDCRAGLVCSNSFGDPGVCKQICDIFGGQPECNSQHVCASYAGLFDGGGQPGAGVCDVACDPLTDNDFDGSGPLTKESSRCGSDPKVGCYGYPSFGTYPRTGWACTVDVNASRNFRHRTQCTAASGCAGPSGVYINSCNQGYVPLLRERTGVTTVVCVALCKPLPCYLNNCGTNNANRLGQAPHRCNNVDRAGTFDVSPGGEHCQYLWYYERDMTGNFLRSDSSDTVGICLDHSKYLYDSNGDNTPDTPLPACATLPDGFGTGTPFGAADLACVDSSRMPQAAPAPRPIPTLDELRVPRQAVRAAIE